MERLPPPDALYFDAAVGWLLLGDTASALAELARLSPTARRLPDVLELEWSIHARRADWPAAYEVARQLVESCPERPSGWMDQAYALRRMPGGGLPRAWEALRPALDKFPDEHLIAYNLACYAAQLNRLDEAWALFQRALAVADKAGDVVKLALQDDDLKPLWPRISAVERP